MICPVVGVSESEQQLASEPRAGLWILEDSQMIGVRVKLWETRAS